MVLVSQDFPKSFDDILDSFQDLKVVKCSDMNAFIQINDFNFNFNFNNDDSVVLETLEILKKGGYVNDGFVPGRSRIEISGDDDPNMDYFNDFLMILSSLSKQSGLLVYELAAQEFV